jgi:membrane protease YdiL (CAAX protease family)
VYGYLSGLPLLIGAMIVSIVLFFIWSAAKAAASGGGAGGPPAPPENPVAELVGGAGTLQLVLLFLLATVWAPLVEETVFRGALFRHLRSRLPLMLAAPVSAVFFGIMHNYPVFLLLPVMTLGFTFALMREWRDSLIGPMVAHSLHNATILAFAISIFRLLGP